MLLLLKLSDCIQLMLVKIWNIPLGKLYWSISRLVLYLKVVFTRSLNHCTSWKTLMVSEDGEASEALRDIICISEQDMNFLVVLDGFKSILRQRIQKPNFYFLFNDKIFYMQVDFVKYYKIKKQQEKKEKLLTLQAFQEAFIFLYLGNTTEQK